jgi:SAM-dependent methyltransferase
MLKMYMRGAHAGGDSEFWDEQWNIQDLVRQLADAERICRNGPVARFLEPAAKPGRLFLEGGCGLGHWVKFFHDRGCQSVGIDYAERTVARIREADRSLDVRVGDIRSLPFKDGEVHTYLSNGVVEHFEDGPEPALREAHRVMAKDGLFFCSVPDASWLRERVLFRNASEALGVERGTLRVRRVAETREEKPANDWQFFQYAFSVDEFTDRLRRAGFEVLSAEGESVLFGVFEIPGVQPAYEMLFSAARKLRDLRRGAEPATSTAPVARAEVSLPPAESRGLRGFVERALFREDPSTPIVGPLVHALAERMSNMRMYVARPV